MIFQNEKKAFLWYKKKFKNSKNWFWSKIRHFSTFVSGKLGQENVSYDILEQKTPLLGYKNKVQKGEKLRFVQRGQSMVLFQILHFSTFVLAQQARKMCFMIFQNEKMPFQSIKTRSSKSPKIDILPKGLDYGFSSKLAIFLHLSQAIQARKMCFMVFQKNKTPF